MYKRQVIETITYKELRELSYMGASVLHEDAIFPVRKEDVYKRQGAGEAEASTGALVSLGMRETALRFRRTLV